jgi:3-hydroxyisobutyrate dehydrogenase-like beta-hydroxyacid dehydrogenase
VLWLPLAPLWLLLLLLLLPLLLLQCGGTDLAVRAAKPILSLMGKSVMHLGDPGAGQVAKICNNLVRDV